MTFALDLRGFAKRTSIQLDVVVRKTAFDVDSDLVKLTPVRTGAARSNYFIGFSSEDNRVSTSVQKSGAPSIQRAAEFITGLRGGTTFWIVNNLPYILPIVEFGTSKQAAPGAVTRLVARWQAIVDGAARESQKSRVEFGKGLS